jgi:hypothetical protein
MGANGPPLVVRLMAEQRKRCLATILNSAESSPWWTKLTAAQQDAYRDQVRHALAIFYDLVRDVIKVSDDDAVRNDLALDLIRSVHSQQIKITERLGSS